MAFATALKSLIPLILQAELLSFAHGNSSPPNRKPTSLSLRRIPAVAPLRLRRGITRFLDDEARFAEAVKLGIAAADRGDFVSAEKVWEDVERILQS